jgi:pimeloyl-ACP methyl ester carboxylesterase
MRSRPLQPGSSPAELDSWMQLAGDLIDFLEQAGARGWVGVGHSLGAVITVAAALRRPELFSAVVVIDPVFVYPLKLLVYKVARRLGLARYISPLVSAAARRRGVFASADEMFARYRAAPVFSRIDDRGLRAYVDALARPRPDDQAPGVELAFRPEWEARIYAIGPMDLWGQIGRLRVPLLAVRGAESTTFEPAAVRALRRHLPSAVIREVPGAGHLVPLEQPVEVGRLIVQFLTSHT